MRVSGLACVSVSIILVFISTQAMPIARELTGAEKLQLANDFAKKLKDPFSARFLWMPFKIMPTETEYRPYCGLINAKNLFGAYAGFAPFAGAISIKNGRVFYGINLTAGDPPEDTAKMCASMGFDLNLAR